MKRDNSHLQSEAVREKRIKAIRRAFRLKKKFALTEIPGETPPVLVHAARVTQRSDDRIELARDIIALLNRVLQ